MKKRILGIDGPELSAIGLGCMGLSEFYGKSNDENSQKIILTALESGITYLDTADCYAAGVNEELIASVLKEWKQKVFIASKFGIVREKGKYERRMDGSAKYVKKAVEASLKRLNVDTIDLYYYHRMDVNTPIEETVSAMSDLVKEGKIKYIGLSEVSSETIKRANKIHKITAVQSEYSLMTRGVEKNILPTLRELGIGFVAYSPLGRGLLSGKLNKEILTQEGDSRTVFAPRFNEENFDHNQKLVDTLTNIAKQKSITTAQLSLAWVLFKGNDIIPIPGTKNIKYLVENIQAVDVSLSKEDIEEIEKAIPEEEIKGERYGEAGLIGLEEY